jgi:hypothetical protein
MVGSNDSKEVNQAVIPKTGTDDLPGSDYKPAYKKLTKNAYSDGQQMSPDVTIKMVSGDNGSQIAHDCKSLETAYLGAKKDALTTVVIAKALHEAEGARTLNLRIDSPMLYPIELRPRLNFRAAMIAGKPADCQYHKADNSRKNISFDLLFYSRQRLV